MTISKDRVKPSPMPDSWKLKEIFATGIVLGGYLALMTVIFFWLMKETTFFSVRNIYLALQIFFIGLTVLIFFMSLCLCVSNVLHTCLFLSLQDKFGVRPLHESPDEMIAALYLQVSIVSQALIFVTRSRSWSYVERPGMLLMGAFLIAQLVRMTFHWHFIIKI